MNNSNCSLETKPPQFTTIYNDQQSLCTKIAKVVMSVALLALSCFLLLSAPLVAPPLALIGVTVGCIGLLVSSITIIKAIYSGILYLIHSYQASKIHHSLMQRKFSEISIEDFIFYLNFKSNGQSSVTYATNCKSLKEVETLCLGDTHEDKDVRDFNTLASKVYFRPRDVIYFEGSTPCKHMIDLKQLPEDVECRTWDTAFETSFTPEELKEKENFFDIYFKISYLFNEILIEARKPEPKSEKIQRISTITDTSLEKYYPNLVKRNGYLNNLCPRDKINALFKQNVNFYAAAIKNEVDYALKSLSKRQIAMKENLLENETANKCHTIVLAGAAHFFKNKENFEKDFAAYIATTKRKYLVIEKSRGEVSMCKYKNYEALLKEKLVSLRALTELLTRQMSEIKENLKEGFLNSLFRRVRAIFI